MIRVAVAVALLAVPALGRANAVDDYIAKLQAEADYAQVHRYDRFKPSDVADCRSRANAAFGDLGTKYAVMNDCLRARKLRAAGH